MMHIATTCLFPPDISYAVVRTQHIGVSIATVRLVVEIGDPLLAKAPKPTLR